MKKERDSIRVMKIDNFRCLLGIKRINRMPDALVRELSGVKKGEDERHGECVLQWFGHVETKGNSKIAKMVRGGSVWKDGQWVNYKKGGLI